MERRCSECGGALPITNRLDITGACECRLVRLRKIVAWHVTVKPWGDKQVGIYGGNRRSIAVSRALMGEKDCGYDLKWNDVRAVKPPRSGGWVPSGDGGWTCCVYQGHYGHPAGKATWLVVYGVHRPQLPDFRWGKTEQRIHPRALELYGYEKARRVGIMAMMGGKNKTRDRNATPSPILGRAGGNCASRVGH